MQDLKTTITTQLSSQIPSCEEHDRQELDRQEHDRQEIDRQEHDRKEIDRQELDRKELDRRQRVYCERQIDRENAIEGNLHKIDGYDCPLCLNRGYISQLEDYNGCYSIMMRFCSCRSIRGVLATLRKNGLDGVMERYTLERFTTAEPWQRSVLTAAETYLAEFVAAGERERPWFFFGGTSGCGKTHVCTALSVELTRRGTPLCYMLWRDEATRLKGCMSDGSYTAEVNRFKTAPLLYVDDLFKTGRGEGQHRQRPTAADLNLAFEIINARYVSRKPTIISSESTLPEIIHFDAAIGGRVKEMCGRFCLNLGEDRGKNWRVR